MNYPISFPKVGYAITMDIWLMENMDKDNYEWQWPVTKGTGHWTLYFKYEEDLVVFKLRFRV